MLITPQVERKKNEVKASIGTWIPVTICDQFIIFVCVSEKASQNTAGMLNSATKWWVYSKSTFVFKLKQYSDILQHPLSKYWTNTHNI